MYIYIYICMNMRGVSVFEDVGVYEECVLQIIVRADNLILCVYDIYMYTYMYIYTSIYVYIYI